MVEARASRTWDGRRSTSPLRIGGLFAAVIVVAIIFLLINPHFANPNLAVSVLRAMSSVAIMAMGLTLVIVVGEIDLSFGAMYGLAANVLAVIWVVHGLPVYLAIPLTLLVAVCVGTFNGLLVTSLKIPSFIVTLGSYNLLYGLSLWVSNSGTFNPNYPPSGQDLPAGQLAFFIGLTQSFGKYQLSAEVFWMLGLACVVGFLLHRSLFGFRLMAIGGNPEAARLARLPVQRYKIAAFILCSCWRRSPAFSTSRSSRRASRTSASRRRSRCSPPSSSAARVSAAARAPSSARSAARCCSRNCRSDLALLSPGPHVQQIFLGAVTIIAVALDLFLTKMRKSGG